MRAVGLVAFSGILPLELRAMRITSISTGLEVSGILPNRLSRFSSQLNPFDDVKPPSHMYPSLVACLAALGKPSSCFECI